MIQLNLEFKRKTNQDSNSQSDTARENELEVVHIFIINKISCCFKQNYYNTVALHNKDTQTANTCEHYRLLSLYNLYLVFINKKHVFDGH